MGIAKIRGNRIYIGVHKGYNQQIWDGFVSTRGLPQKIITSPHGLSAPPNPCWASPCKPLTSYGNFSPERDTKIVGWNGFPDFETPKSMAAGGSIKKPPSKVLWRVPSSILHIGNDLTMPYDSPLPRKAHQDNKKGCVFSHAGSRVVLQIDQGRHTKPGLFLVQILFEPLAAVQQFQKPQGPLCGQMSGDVVNISSGYVADTMQTLYITHRNV